MDRLDDAVPLARALVAGGVRLLKITLHPAGLDGAWAIMQAVPDAVVGVGNVLTPDDLRRAVEAGARFAPSPGITLDLLAAAAVPISFPPGVATASELIAALAREFTTAKYFPTAATDDLPASQALAGQLPQARFCPIGGLIETIAAEWLAQPTFVAVRGSWLPPAGEIAAVTWNPIRDRAARPARGT